MSRKTLVFLGLVLLAVFGILCKQKFQVSHPISSDSISQQYTGDPGLLSNPAGSDFLPLEVINTENVNIEWGYKNIITSNGFSVYFPGDMENRASFNPSIFIVYYKEHGKNWTIAEKLVNYKKPVYRLSLKNNIQVEGYRIVIEKEDIPQTIWIADLQVTQLSSVDLARYLSWNWERYGKELPSYILLSLFMLGFILLPGYSILKTYIRDQVTCLVFGPILSIFILILLTIFYLIFGKDIIFWSYPIYFIFGLFIFFKKRLYHFDKEVKFIIWILIVSIISTSILQSIRDTLLNLNYIEPKLDKLPFIPFSTYFGYHADNFFPWGIARAIIQRVSPASEIAKKLILGSPATAYFDRTPLLSFTVTPILSIFGEGHFIYQRFANVLVALYYSAIYWVIRNISSKKISKLTTILTLLSVPISLTTFNAELNIKYLSLYFLLISTGIVLKHEKYFLASIFFAIAFLTHPMVILFLPAILLLASVNSDTFKHMLCRIIAFISIPLLIIILWNIGTFLAKYNLSLNRSNGSVSNIYFYFKPDSLYFSVKAANIVNIFIPDFLHKTFSTFFSREYLLAFFRYSVLGSVSPFFIYLIFRNINQQNKNNFQASLILAVVPHVIFWLHPHGYDFSSFSLLFPFTSIFLFAIVAKILFDLGLKYRIFYILSFSLFMLLSLIYSSGTFPDINYTNPAIRIYSLFMMILYIYLITITLHIIRSKSEIE